jgi:osmotically-inducible protein OsmY
MRVASLFLILSLLAVCCAVLTAAQTVSDDKIYDDVKIKLASDTTVMGAGLDIEVKEGVVTLNGKVRNQKQKDRAERLTKRVKGVVKVINNLVVAPQAV